MKYKAINVKGNLFSNDKF